MSRTPYLCHGPDRSEAAESGWSALSETRSRELQASRPTDGRRHRGVACRSSWRRECPGGRSVGDSRADDRHRAVRREARATARPSRIQRPIIDGRARRARVVRVHLHGYALAAAVPRLTCPGRGARCPHMRCCGVDRERRTVLAGLRVLSCGDRPRCLGAVATSRRSIIDVPMRQLRASS